MFILPLQGMKWDDLSCKKTPAPFKPVIRSEMDVSNFSEEFTTMVVADSPAIVPMNGEKLFKVNRSVLWPLRLDTVKRYQHWYRYHFKKYHVASFQS